jgi:hypothetical protein
MKTTRFTDEQIIGFLKQAEAGMSIKELCRSGGFSQPSFYKCRSKFGGMEGSDASHQRSSKRPCKSAMKACTFAGTSLGDGKTACISCSGKRWSFKSSKI